MATLWRPKSSDPIPTAVPAKPKPTKQFRQLREQLVDCAREAGGQVTARTRAAGLGQAYRALEANGKLEFLDLLAKEFGPNPTATAKAHAAYAESIGTPNEWKSEMALREAVISPRSRILTQFNALPDGLKFLMDLRADLLRFQNEHPDLAVLDQDLKAQLTSWFDVGFLTLERITWHSPAALLEKLIEYEAVHAIQSWADLKNRLDSDRRCYAFFHPRMPLEPLIFVEIALTSQLSSNIESLLDEHAPVHATEKADTAIFYSISSAQVGLRGVSLGNFLLKRVIEDLQRDLPRLKVFSTLSPMPRFRMWLDECLAGKLEHPLKVDDFKKLAAATGDRAGRPTLRRVLGDAKWSGDAVLAEALREPMTKLAAYYLLRVKKDTVPADPVARFHLGNGSRVERLNWLADRSVKGFAESYGMMVNYRYLPDDIEENVESFTYEGKIAATSVIQRAAGM